MPKTYYGYILRELVEAFVIALTAYTFVMTLGTMFKSLQAGLGVMFVVRVLPSALPSTLPWTVPVSVLTACVIAYGRLSSDNEVIALNALGAGPLHIIAPALIMATAITVPMLYCNHFVEPRSHEMFKAALKEAAIMRPFSVLSFDEPVFKLSDVKIYIGEATENRLTNVIIFREKDDLKRENEKGELVVSSGNMQVTYADSATYEIVGDGANRELRLTLHNVVVKFINRSERFGYNPIRFDTTTERISLAEKAFIPGWKDMTTPELLKELKKYSGPDALPITDEELNKLLTRLRMRWSSAFDVLSLALLGVPLGVLTKKGRKMVGFGVSVLVVVLIYFPLVVCGKAMSSNGVFMAALWPWASVFVVAALGIVLIHRQVKV